MPLQVADSCLTLVREYADILMTSTMYKLISWVMHNAHWHKSHYYASSFLHRLHYQINHILSLGRA